MNRDDIYNTLDEIITRKDLLKEEEFIRIDENTTVLIDTFLDMFVEYDLTFTSLSNVESSGWKSRFKDWNEQGILPD